MAIIAIITSNKVDLPGSFSIYHPVTNGRRNYIPITVSISKTQRTQKSHIILFKSRFSQKISHFFYKMVLLAINTTRMHLDFQCIEERFRLGPARLARRWKAASQCGMTHNAGIFHWKNRWNVTVTRSVFRNRCIEIRKWASTKNNFKSWQNQGYGLFW